LCFLKRVYKKIKSLIRKVIKEENIQIHSVYGKIYPPIYNLQVPIKDKPLEIYNSDGMPMNVFFIRDQHCAHGNGPKSKYFIWDRFNLGLETHFYTHNCMLETMGKPSKKYGWLVESESICPNDYNIFLKHAGLEKEFNFIFTFSEKILNSISNARLVPFSMDPSVSASDNRQYQKKNKNISIIASGKDLCELHRLRNSLALTCKNAGIADAFGKHCGGGWFENHEPFLDYRFSVVVENDVSAYYFTEKVTSCFSTFTIPVYLGALKINEFFNKDGIITFSPKDNIEQILKKCTREEYENRLPAVIDNYNRIMKYGTVFDRMYEDYIK